MAGVITGTGMVTSIGADTETCFVSLCNGVSGNKPLQAFDGRLYNLTRAYEIADRSEGRDVKGRATNWLCASVEQAVRASGLVPGEQRLAVLVGTGLRELRGLELWWADGQPFGVEELHFGGALRRKLGAGVAVTTLSNACAASSFALGLADDMLALGEADAVIVAGADSITESMFGLGDRASMLRPERVQPFERERRGALLGEGAAAVVVESAERARTRGAVPLALLRGVGMSCDAFHETAPDREGMRRAMIDAHRRAGVSPSEINLLMAHGTGTELNDKVEALAIKDAFGEHSGQLVITALKSMLGHTSGGSGLMSVITAVECLRRGQVPPTVGFHSPMEEAEGLDIVAGEARVAQLRLAQVNAFGFGGVNAVVVLEKAGP